MKQVSVVLAAVLLTATLALPGCGASKTVQGAGIGAASGAAVGAGIGAIAGGGKGAAWGAGIGSVVGGTAGAIIGNKINFTAHSYKSGWIRITQRIYLLNKF